MMLAFVPACTASTVRTAVLGDGQRVHVGPQQDHRAFAAPQHTGHPCGADTLGRRDP